MKPNSYAALFIVLSVLLVTFLFAGQKEKEKAQKTLVFGIAVEPFVPSTSLGGKGTADARELTEIILNEFQKLHGYSVNYKIFPAPKFHYNAFQDSTVDAGIMSLEQYLYAKNHGVPVVPLISGKFTPCIYVHKDSKIKHVKDLKGKSFVDRLPEFNSKNDTLPPEESYIRWIMLKRILLKHGVRSPFADFFREFRLLPIPNESVAYSVLLKKFDAFLLDVVLIQSLKNYDPGFSDLVTVSCLNDPILVPLVYRKGLSQDVISSIKNYFLTPPKGSTLEKIFKKQLKNVSLQSLALSEKDFDIYFSWLKEAKQKGWIDEYNEIMKNTPMPAKKGEIKKKQKYIYEKEE